MESLRAAIAAGTLPEYVAGLRACYAWGRFGRSAAWECESRPHLWRSMP